MAIATKSSSKPQPFRSLIEKARNIHCRKENIPKNVEPRCKSDSKFTKSFPPKKKKYWQGTCTCTGIIAVGTAVRDVFAKRTAQARAPPAVEVVLLSFILRVYLWALSLFYKSAHIHKYFKSWATCFEDQTEHFLNRNYTFSPAGDISWNVSAAFSLMQYVVQTYHLCGNVKVLPFRCLLHNLSSWWHEKTFLCSNRWLPGWVRNQNLHKTYNYKSIY